MSKKNDLQKRRRAHERAVAAEAAAKAKREARLAKAKLKGGVVKRKSARKRANRARVLGGVKVRKNVVVGGIRVKDAASKTKVKQLLAERALRKMDVDG